MSQLLTLVLPAAQIQAAPYLSLRQPTGGRALPRPLYRVRLKYRAAAPDKFSLFSMRRVLVTSQTTSFLLEGQALPLEGESNALLKAFLPFVGELPISVISPTMAMLTIPTYLINNHRVIIFELQRRRSLQAAWKSEARTLTLPKVAMPRFNQPLLLLRGQRGEVVINGYDFDFIVKVATAAGKSLAFEPDAEGHQLRLREVRGLTATAGRKTLLLEMSDGVVVPLHLEVLA